MRHVFALFLALPITLLAAAENTQIGSLPKQSNKLPYTLEAVLASEQVKDSTTHEVAGVYTSLKTSLLYSVTDKDELRLYASVVSEDYDYKNYEDKRYPEFGEVMYRRKAILNESSHGVNLDFELKHGVVLEDDNRDLWGFSSETIPQVIFKKRLPKGFGTEFKARHHYYHRNNAKKSTLFEEDRLYLSFSKMFGHSLIFNNEFRYRHKTYTGAHYSWARGGKTKREVEDLIIHPGLLYFLNRKTLIEGYVETKLNDTFDSRDTKTLAQDELIIGAALYLTIL